MELPLENGASPNGSRSRIGSSPWVREAAVKEAPLEAGAKKDEEEIVRILMRNGADAELKDKRGMTPLHIAAAQSSEDTVRALLEGDEGLKNAKDSYGRTPLHLTSENGKEPLSLLGHGADVNAEDRRDLYYSSRALLHTVKRPTMASRFGRYSHVCGQEGVLNSPKTGPLDTLSTALYITTTSRSLR